LRRAKNSRREIIIIVIIIIVFATVVTAAAAASRSNCDATAAITVATFGRSNDILRVLVPLP